MLRYEQKQDYELVKEVAATSLMVCVVGTVLIHEGLSAEPKSTVQALGSYLSPASGDAASPDPFSSQCLMRLMDWIFGV